MSKQIWVTDKIHGMLVAAAKSHSLQKLEGLAHCILMDALTDDAAVGKGAATSRYLGDHGATTLEKMGL